MGAVVGGGCSSVIGGPVMIVAVVGVLIGVAILLKLKSK